MQFAIPKQKRDTPVIISEKASEAMRQAVCQRGKNKGTLLARAPQANTAGNAAWQAVAMHYNPYKVSIGAFMFMSAENRAIYDEWINIFETLDPNAIANIDRDRVVLQGLGIW